MATGGGRDPRELPVAMAVLCVVIGESSSEAAVVLMDAAVISASSICNCSVLLSPLIATSLTWNIASGSSTVAGVSATPASAANPSVSCERVGGMEGLTVSYTDAPCLLNQVCVDVT